jgi:hypothetical protein
MQSTFRFFSLVLLLGQTLGQSATAAISTESVGDVVARKVQFTLTKSDFTCDPTFSECRYKTKEIKNDKFLRGIYTPDGRPALYDQSDNRYVYQSSYKGSRGQSCQIKGWLAGKGEMNLNLAVCCAPDDNSACFEYDEAVFDEGLKNIAWPLTVLIDVVKEPTDTTADIGKIKVYSDNLPTLKTADFICAKPGSPCRFKTSVPMDANVRNTSSLKEGGRSFLGARVASVVADDKDLGRCSAAFSFPRNASKTFDFEIVHYCMPSRVVSTSTYTNRKTLEWAIANIPTDLKLVLDRIEDNSLTSKEVGTVVTDRVTFADMKVADLKCDKSFSTCSVRVPELKTSPNYRGAYTDYAYKKFTFDGNPDCQIYTRLTGDLYSFLARCFKKGSYTPDYSEKIIETGLATLQPVSILVDKVKIP